jgi:ribosomal protein S18 acetylase RimI-like enzyme
MEREVDIRQAQLRDVPALAGLLEELFATESEFEADRDVQEAGLRLLLTEPGDSVVFVACRGGALVGMVSLLAQASTALGGRAYVLEDMIVTAAERGGGLGGQLLDHALAHADAAGARRVTLLADADNDGARRFYARRGFTRSGMVVLRRQQPFHRSDDGPPGDDATSPTTT